MKRLWPAFQLHAALQQSVKYLSQAYVLQSLSAVPLVVLATTRIIFDATIRYLSLPLTNNSFTGVAQLIHRCDPDDLPKTQRH